jgi:hypothetical protein
MDCVSALPPSFSQVALFGGQAFNASASTVRISTMLYVLDFASSPPRWRQAAIKLNNQGAFQLDFPSTGIVMLPEFGAVALKHRSVGQTGLAAARLPHEPGMPHKLQPCARSCAQTS